MSTTYGAGVIKAQSRTSANKHGLHAFIIFSHSRGRRRGRDRGAFLTAVAGFLSQRLRGRQLYEHCSTAVHILLKFRLNYFFTPREQTNYQIALDEYELDFQK